MNFFVTLYTEGLFRPLFNLLVGLTNVLPDHSVGLAIIGVTLIVRLILLPSSLQQARSAHRNQSKMKELSGELADIKKKHKDDKQKQAQETMALYKRAGVNPAAGCLPLLIQLPVLLALYRVFLTGISEETYHHLYGFVAAPPSIVTTFLGVDLNQPSVVFGIVAGLGQFFLMRFFTPSPAAQPGANEDTAQMMASMQRNMMYFFPAMTVFIALQLPAALSLYWAASTLFAIVQQIIVKRVLHLEGAAPLA